MDSQQKLKKIFKTQTKLLNIYPKTYKNDQKNSHEEATGSTRSWKTL